MPPSDDLPVMAFPSPEALGRWLAEHHATAPGFWLVIPRKGSGLEGPSYAEALDEALRFGWIDSQKQKHDERSFLQRFTPRRPRSPWSKVNRDKIAALIAAGRLEPAGAEEVRRAQEDGRWEAAYGSTRTATVPEDLQRALDACPEAAAFFGTLSATRRFQVLYRVQEAKRAATRERRIAAFVEGFTRGEAP